MCSRFVLRLTPVRLAKPLRLCLGGFALEQLLTDASELVFGRAGDSIHTCCSRTGSVCVCVSAEASAAPLVATARVALRRAERCSGWYFVATVALLKCLVSPRPSRVPVSRVLLNGDVRLNRGQMSVSVADVSLIFLVPLFQPPGTQRLLIMFFDSSVFSDDTIVVDVAQLSVGAGFVL